MVSPNAIKMDSVLDAIFLNNLAFEYKDKLILESGSAAVDLRSLLALFTLIGKKNLKLVAPDHSDSDKFIKILEKINAGR